MLWVDRERKDVGAQFIAPSWLVVRREGAINCAPTFNLSPIIFSQLRCRTCIEHPHNLSVGGAYNLRGVLFGLVRAFEDGLYGLRFLAAGDKEKDVACRVQQRWGEGQARWGRFGYDHGYHQSLLLMQ